MRLTWKHIKEFKEKDDLKDYVKNLIMDYREHPILNFSVDDVCRALSEEYFSNIMEEIYFHYEDLRETPNRYDIAGNLSILHIIHMAFYNVRDKKMMEDN